MNKLEICQEICELKNRLKNSDYKVLKHIENELTEDEYLEIKQERQAWRDRINELQEELNSEEIL